MVQSVVCLTADTVVLSLNPSLAIGNRNPTQYCEKASKICVNNAVPEFNYRYHFC